MSPSARQRKMQLIEHSRMRALSQEFFKVVLQNQSVDLLHVLNQLKGGRINCF